MENFIVSVKELNQHLRSEDPQHQQKVYAALAQKILTLPLSFEYEDFYFAEDHPNDESGCPDDKIFAQQSILFPLLTKGFGEANDCNILVICSMMNKCQNPGLLMPLYWENFILKERNFIRSLMFYQIASLPPMNAEDEKTLLLQSIKDECYVIASSRLRYLDLQLNYSEALDSLKECNNVSPFPIAEFLIKNTSSPKTFDASLEFLDVWVQKVNIHSVHAEKLALIALENFLKQDKRLISIRGIREFCHNSDISPETRLEILSAILLSPTLIEILSEEEVCNLIDVLDFRFNYRNSDAVKKLFDIYYHLATAGDELKKETFKTILACTYRTLSNIGESLGIWLDFMIELTQKLGGDIPVESGLYRTLHQLNAHRLEGRHTDKIQQFIGIFCEKTSGYNKEILKAIIEFWPEHLDKIRYMKLNGFHFLRTLLEISQTSHEGIRAICYSKAIKIINELPKEDRILDFPEAAKSLAVIEGFPIKNLPKNLAKLVSELREQQAQKAAFLKKFIG